MLYYYISLFKVDLYNIFSHLQKVCHRLFELLWELCRYARNIKTNCNSYCLKQFWLTHFKPLVSFYTPCKYQKTYSPQYRPPPPFSSPLSSQKCSILLCSFFFFLISQILPCWKGALEGGGCLPWFFNFHFNLLRLDYGQISNLSISICLYAKWYYHFLTAFIWGNIIRVQLVTAISVQSCVLLFFFY